MCRIGDQLESEQLVETGFKGSLHERECIVSTLVYTVLAPQGFDWGNGETATLVFANNEEVMGVYDLFLALMNEKASRNLLACRDFNDFKALSRTGS